MMESHIFLGAKRESSVLFPTNHTFAVSLACAVTGADDEQEAKDRFQELLREVHACSLELWQVGSANSPAGPAKDQNGSPVIVTAYPQNGGDVSSLMDWLQNSASKFKDDAADAATVELESQIPASILLRACPQWDAPIPQQLKLLRLLSFQWNSDPTVNLVLLPTIAGYTWSFYGANGDLYSFKSADTILQTQSLSLTPLPTIDNISKDGFLLQGRPANRRIRDALQQQAPSLLWAAPVLCGADAKLFADGKMSWEYALAAATCLLDPILTALHMPGTQAEGPLLAPFFEILDGILAHPKDDTGTELQPVQNRWDMLHRILANLRTLLKSKWEVNGKTERIELLKKVLNLEENDPLLAALNSEQPTPYEPCMARLRELMAFVQVEGGCEEVVIKVLKPYLNPDDKEPATVPDKLLQGVEAVEKKAIVAAFQAYAAHLRDAFNGAEAVRQACGQVILTLVANHQGGLRGGLETIGNSEFFLKRISSDPLPDPFPKVLLEALPPQYWTPILNVDKLRNHCANSLKQVVAQLARHSRRDGNWRFLPDPNPRPLDLTIFPDMKADTVKRFSQAFPSLGVLVCGIVEQEGQEEWRHVCLADYSLGPPPKPDEQHVNGVLAQNALLPIKPTVSDGSSEMFVAYHGMPLSSAAFEPKPSQEGPQRYYIAKDAAYKVPALVYGRNYRAAAFVCGHSGALPPNLRLTPQEPWLPKPVGFTPPDDATAEAIYQRTTMIGGLGLKEGREGVAVPGGRLNREYKDVFPLSRAKPRLALMAQENHRPCLDLFRNDDGSGGLETKDRHKLQWTLNELTLSGSPQLDAELRWFKDGKEEFHTGTVTPQGQTLEVSFDINEQTFDSPPFLRLVCSGRGSLSFARPEADASALQVSTQTEPPLLLLAADDGSWRPEFTPTFEATLSLPRVSVEDFERWWPRETELTEKYPDLADLLLGVKLLQEHPDFSKLEPFLRCLPDLAVRHLMVELIPLHRQGPAQRSSLDIDPLPQPGANTASTDESSISITGYNRVLKEIDKNLNRNLTIELGKEAKVTTSDGGVKITIPGGIWILRLRPMVKKDLFGIKKPLDERLIQYAVGETDDHYFMEGLSLTIECLEDGLKDLKPADLTWQAAFVSRHKGADRQYQLLADVSKLDLPKTQYFQYASHVETFTQRWRFSGVPIDAWIDPHEFDADKDDQAREDGRAILRLSPGSKAEKLKLFEAQLFYDRDPNDAHGNTVELIPGGSTLLKTVAAQEPQATYLRHRFTLWSRYRGAMVKGTKSVNSWLEGEDPLAAWTMRFAVLADAGLTKRTPPQLRALVPTSSALDPKAAESTPPLIAIVEEPPYGIGGLAERMLAGIHVGMGYGFPDEKMPVQPLDLRKEIGKDPRLSLKALEEALAQAAVVEVVGPVGLTFDHSGTSAPTWRNCQFALQPNVLSNQGLIEQESFLALRMMRMLDKAWTVGLESPSGESVDPLRPWEFELTQTQDLMLGSETIVRVTGDDKGWEVKMNIAVLDPSVDSDRFLTMARAEGKEPLSLLHTPLEAGSYALAVVVGSSHDAPHLLGAIEWRPSKGKEGKLSCAGAKISELRLSLPTFAQWCRSARRADTLYCQEENSQEAKPIAIEELKFRSKYGKLEAEKGRLLPFRQPRRHPQTVHRMLAAVFTRDSKELGRKIDLYADAYLILNTSFQCPEEASKIRFLEFQLPARSVCNRTEGIPQGYQKAYLDIAATSKSKNTAGNGEQMLLTILVRLTQNIKEPVFNVSPSLTATDRSLQLLAIHNLGDFWLLHVDAGQAEGVWVSFSGEPEGGGEAWADVSFLPGHLTEESKLDWDWFFSAQGGQPDVVKAAQPDALKELLEPCAQLVSLSLPIRLAVRVDS